jgi:hypothetical protein
MQAAQHRFSHQIRPIHPEANADIHPRAVEMAEAMREGDDTFRALKGRGFSDREIRDFSEAAQQLARENSVRHLSPRPDALEEVIEKAKMAMPNRPPLPRGTTETQAVLTLWSGYCMARTALTFDPWPLQRERCLAILRNYLNRTQLFEHSKREIVEAVAASFPKVAQ